MVLHREFLTITPATGTGTGTTIANLNGMIRQILVNPTTATTTYEMSITDISSLITYKTTGRIGQMAPTTAIPIKGPCTITISNASVDEEFTVVLVIEKPID